MIRCLLYRLIVTILRMVVRPRDRVHYRLTVLKLDRLGDAVLALGAVRALASVFGEEQMLLIVSTAAARLFRHEFPSAGLLVMPPFSRRFWPDYLLSMVRHAHALRAISTDDLVCLRHQHSDYLYSIAALMDAARSHASMWGGNHEHTCLSFPRWSPTPYPESAARGCLELEAHRRLVSKFTAEDGFEQVIPVLNRVSAIEGHSLVVCPVAGDHIREYPADQLAEALQLFLQSAPDTRIQFCLPSGSDCGRWRTALNDRGINVLWVFPSDEVALAQVIAESALVLAPDSAPAHLATALDKPGVFLLGGGHYGMFAPWHRSARQKWLSHAMDCYQCQWNCCQREAYCITKIAPEAIADALLSLDHALRALD